MSGSTVYAGGVFSSVCDTAASSCWNGAAQTRNRLAAFDSNGALAAWNPGAGGSVQALAVSGSTIYAGGVFSSVCTTAASSCWNGSAAQTRNRLAAFGSDGALAAWNPGAGGTVQALAVSGSTVYAGGQFTTVCDTAASSCWNGSAAQTRNRLAAFGVDGALAAWNPDANSTVNALAVSGSTVYAGGGFTGVCTTAASSCWNGATQTRNFLAAFGSDGALAAWNPGASSIVYALAVSGSTVYAGGLFTSVCTTAASSCWNGSAAQTRYRLAAFGVDGALAAWNPDANSTVNALAVSGSTVYAGGSFLIVGGQTRNRLAAIVSNGALAAWNPGADGTVYALAVSGSTVYAGGVFSSVCDTAASSCWNGAAQTRNRLAAFDSNGALAAWNPGAGGSVQALAVSGSTIYAGGVFSSVCDTAASSCWNGSAAQTRNRLAAFDSNGALAAWNPGASTTVNALAVSGSTVYAGGFFTSVCTTAASSCWNGAAQTRNRLAAFGSDGALAAWNPDANNTVNALAVSGPDVFVGGNFSQVTNERVAGYPTAYFTALQAPPCGSGLPLTTGLGALWQQLALPCVPSASPADVKGVFGTGSLSNLTTTDYGTPNPGAGTGWVIDRREVTTTPSSYVRLTKDDALAVGTGYWIKSYQAPSNGMLSVAGTATATDVTQGQGCAVAAGCKAVTVTTVNGDNRYNLVGNPFPYAIDWSTVRIRVGGPSGSVYTPCQAAGLGAGAGCAGSPASPPVLSHTVNIWNGTTYVAFSDLAPTQGNLKYFKSFWVNVLPGAAGQTVELLIPAEQTSLPLSQAAPAVAQVEATASDWQVRLKLDNHTTGWRDHGNQLGQWRRAKSGADALDVPELAPFAKPYLTLVFPHSNWGAKAGDYTTDFRPFSTRRTDWSFEVRADPAGAVVFLSWDGDPAILARSRLIDRQTGQVIQPAATRWAKKGYPITLKNPVQRYVWRYLGP